MKKIALLAVSVAMRSPKPTKTNRSKFHGIIRWLHLWLGLITGTVVFIICTCACIWVFNEEITAVVNSGQSIQKQDAPIIKPSQLLSIADSIYPNEKPAYAMYKQGRPISLHIGETITKVNPYTAAIISSQKEEKTNFFDFILRGHRNLWLPAKIGRPVVNYSTLIFVLSLLSGMILWWPRRWTKATRRQSFRIKRARLNYDLHKILGFYGMLFLISLALSGMVFGLEWYSNGLYWVTSGGKAMPQGKIRSSDTAEAGKHFTPKEVMDHCWNEVIANHPTAEGFYYGFADTSRPSAAINITIYPSSKTVYNIESFAFDQHTGKALPPAGSIYDGSFDKAKAADKLRRMNYDIHIGAVLGLPGKILAFFASLIGASLPITGFRIWWKRRKAKSLQHRTPVLHTPVA